MLEIDIFRKNGILSNHKWFIKAINVEKELRPNLVLLWFVHRLMDKLNHVFVNLYTYTIGVTIGLYILQFNNS